MGFSAMNRTAWLKSSRPLELPLHWQTPFPRQARQLALQAVDVEFHYGTLKPVFHQKIPVELGDSNFFWCDFILQLDLWFVVLEEQYELLDSGR